MPCIDSISASLLNRVVKRLFIEGLWYKGQLDIDDGSICFECEGDHLVRVTFDEVLAQGIVVEVPPSRDRHDYKTLHDWFVVRDDCGVLVRFEIPECNLRNAIYGRPIERVSIEQDTRICPPVVKRVVVDIGDVSIF